jgi:hypothetical protein
MKNREKGLFILAIIAACWLLFNLAMSHIYQEDLLLKQNPTNPVGYFMIVGFAVILIFFIAAFIWLLNQLRRQKGDVLTIFALLLCGLSIVSLMGQKIMYDEIARELPLGAAGGESLLLVILFCIQLVFSLVMIFRLKRPIHTQ